MDLYSYIKSLQGKRIAVVGIGVSNLPLITLLLEHGCNVTACDKRRQDEFLDTYETLSKLGADFCLGETYLDALEQYDLIFRTPGLHPDVLPLKRARAAGAVISSEMELFFSLCPCKTIAVTGSDGKTTTTTIISQLLKARGYCVHLGGNIGTPLLSQLPEIKADDFAVLELSSFQLHSMQCKPDIAVITNISPNHLDVHPDMDDYVYAKQSIFQNQDANCRLVLNAKDPYTEKFIAHSKGELLLFGYNSENGTIQRDGNIYWIQQGTETLIMPASEIKIPGSHNVENYMAAFAAVRGLVPVEICRQTAQTFGGVAHRLELIRTLHGVSYYNDSIASSPTRTIAGLHALAGKSIYLIAGGYDKKIPFTELGEEIIKHTKGLFLTGDTAEKIKAAVEDAAEKQHESIPVTMSKNLKEAVLAAKQAAKSGDIVLLSPACASFDAFQNFAQRGDYFREIVHGLE